MANETKGGTSWFNQAYVTAGGSGQGNLAAVRGMQKIGNIIAEPVKKELKKRRDQFSAFSNWELTRKPGLTDEDYNKKLEELNKMKADYIWADSTSRQKIMRHMVDMKAEQDAYDAQKQDLANSIENTESGIGGNTSFMESDEGELMLGAVKNGLQDTDKDGYLDSYVDSNGKIYSKEDITKIIQTNSKDNNSQILFASLAAETKDFSRSYGTSFDWDTNYNKVSTIVDSGNFRSLIEDVQFGTTSFKEDLFASLLNKTYSQFNVTDQNLQNVDPNTDNDPDNISTEDALTIVQKFCELDNDGNPVNNDLDNYVKTYFTGHIENQFQKPFGDNAKYYNMFGQEITQEEAREQELSIAGWTDKSGIKQASPFFQTGGVNVTFPDEETKVNTDYR
tara:strand:+ start:15541 stop:16719 length:1179 start_codon:yes stop_codon:yes gene_type:complete